MVDITARLVWYRLGEAANEMADKYSDFLDWWGGFSVRRVDLLDMLFLGWILLAFVAVGLINIYVRFFAGKSRGKGGGWETRTVSSIGAGVETCSWLNDVMGWILNHTNNGETTGARIVDALNKEAKNLPVSYFPTSST